MPEAKWVRRAEERGAQKERARIRQEMSAEILALFRRNDGLVFESELLAALGRICPE